ATGVAPTVGNWSPFTATYTATLADNGSPIEILLDSRGEQGSWDMVSLTAVPEPATWAMLIVGFGMVGFAARRRKAAVAA
ncbi:MAG: PEPxxWA-CTERM sorting domain-containing protein, partial [Sandarakinorhabdus sp.]